MRDDVIRKYAAPVPRYTSYPTAPHFSAAIGPAQYEQWLVELPQDCALSLYVHIPYCQQLCWYCGCNTKATRQYGPIGNYLGALQREIAYVASLLPSRHETVHIHWGGGSPNILAAADITALSTRLREAFQIAPGVEFAVEIDPRHCEPARVAALAAAGVNRISLGVQDFRPEVQQAIGRIQTFEETRAAVTALRAAGVGSINIDLMYGLPLQTLASVDATISQVLDLAPDRLAIFGYAHLPERLRHQRLIPASALPDPVLRFRQAEHMSRRLEAAGYVRIGLDHYAKPGDRLASGEVNRNFQGYTSDQATTLIALGASAIGQLPQGFVQNTASPAEYTRRVEASGLATARGLALGDDDRLRAEVIMTLMCDLRFSRSRLRARFGAAAAAMDDIAEDLLANDSDGLLTRTSDGFEVREQGRPFLRTICAAFDAYLAHGKARHSAGV